MKDLNKTLQEIQDANREWRGTFDAMDEALALLDADGRILRCNKAMADFAEMSYSEIIGKDCGELCICLGGHREECPVVRCRKTLKREFSAFNSGGRWFEVSADPIVGERGEFQGVVHILQEVTQRKQLEEALRRSEEKFRYFFESANDTFFIVDMKGRLIDINRTGCERLGYSREELLGKSVSELDPPEYAAKVPQRMAQIAEFGNAVFESAHVAKSGRIIPVEINARVIDYAGQKMVLSVVRDISERRHAEDALRESEERYRLLFLKSPIGVFHYSSDLIITDCNERFAEILKTSREKLINLDMNDLRDKRVIGPIREAVQGSEGHYEGQYITTLTNLELYISIHTAPLVDNSGAVSGGIGIVEDITELKHSETVLRESEARYRNVVENAYDMIQSVSPEGRFLYVNPAWLRTMGYTLDEISDMTIFDIVHPACMSKCSGVFGQVSAGVPIEHYETQFMAKDGRVLDIEGSASVSVVDGMVKSIQCLLHDVTERKRLEEELFRSQKDWEYTFDSITDMVTVHDRDFNIIMANKAAEKILGLPLIQDMQNRKCYSYYHGTSAAPAGCPSCGCLQTGKPALFEIFEPHLDMYIEIRAIPRFDSNRNLIGLIHIVRDITERRKAEAEHERLNREKEHLREQLLQSQKMEAIGTLAGGIAHDFNNILNVIIGYGGLMDRMPELTGRAKEYLSEIISAGDRAAYLTRGLLAFGRKQHLELKPADLNVIIKSITAMLHRIIGEDIRMGINLSQESPVIICDAGQIEQIVVNLVTNARDAMPKGGTLTLQTEFFEPDEAFRAQKGLEPHGRYALIRLTDTGTGMDDVTRERIFEPFYTTKPVGKGTGLGLSIIYGIVMQHSGFLECQSSPGRGTEFRVYLPLAGNGETGTASAKTAETAARGRGELILVAEDDESGRRLLRVVLEHQGYRVVEAVTGVDVIEKFSRMRQDIALLLLDVIMPDMSGYEAFLLIKETAPEVKAILMSGYTADILEEKGVQDIAIPLLKKPVSPHELLKLVRSTLDSRV